MGWFLNDELFDFGTLITEPITLISKWEEHPVELIEDAKIVFDFKDLGGNEGTDLYDRLEDLNVFVDAEHFVSASSTGKFYAGTDRIKFSTGSVNGDLTLVFENNVRLSTVVIYAHAWSGDTASIKINEEDSISIDQELLRYVIVLSENTNEITFKATKRVLIYKIELYGEQADIDVPEYEVTFNPDNGESSTIQNVMEGGYATLPSSEPTKEGYNFLGWYLEDLEFDFTNTPIIRDVEIKAKWEMIIAEYIEDASVEFSFDNLTSEGTRVSDTYLTDKYTDTLLSDIIISGSVYDGNSSGSTNYGNTTGLIKFGTGSVTGGLKFVFNENVLIKTIIIYAAGWTASEGQLRVNGNNPAGESNLADIETRYVIVLDEATNEITIGTSSKRAFLFAVGFYGPEAEVPAAPVITEWEVSFDLGYDGSPVIKPVIVEDEKAVNEPSKPSREGYTFKGWFIGENEFDFDTLITEAITLTAHWEEAEPVVEYTITFYDDEGILLETLVVVEGEMPSPQTPTKAETATHKFEFDGWDPELVVASEDAIYHATFKATEKVLYDYTETFDASNATTENADGSFTGVNGVVWTYVHSRNEGLGTSDDSHIDGKGIMLRRAADKSSLSATFTNGIGEFSFEYRKAFTGVTARKYAVDVTHNGTTTTYDLPEFGSGSGAQETIYEFTQALNLTGTVTIKIYATGTAQATFDNFAWTEHGDVEHNTVQFGGSTGEDATVYTVNLTDLNYTGVVVVKIKNVGTTTDNRQTVIDNVVWIENE